MSVIELTLDKVERSKIYVSQSETVQFKHPMDYLQPFMEEVEPLGVTWSFTAEKGSKNKNSEDDTEGNIAYSRLIAKAKLNSEFDFSVNHPFFNKLFTEIGFVYSLDGQKPEMKVYKGNRVQVCTNMCVWNSSDLLHILMTGTSVNNIYEKTKGFVDRAVSDLSKAKELADRLNNEVYKEQMVNQKFGELFRFGVLNPKLGSNPVSLGIQEMLTKSSKYSLDDDGSTTAWNMFNAVTEQLKKSSILDEASKTLILSKMFLSEN